MPGGFYADLITGDGYVVVSLSGELDLAEAPTLRETLEKVTMAGAGLIVVDAADLTFLDSSGIGVLVGAHKEQAATGGQFVIANLADGVGRPVRITEVDTAIPVHWGDPVVRPWLDVAADSDAILTTLGLDVTASDQIPDAIV